jgi:hypothetical protein
MPKTAATEWLLALFAGRTRAAAILGDLTEMAHTRGRLWFWMAYARTLFSLTWRVVLALVVATAGRQIIDNSFHIYIWHAFAAWRTTSNPFLLSSGPILYYIMDTLWFVLPFAAVRYGVRDRFVQLTFAVAVWITVAFFFFIPWASLLCAAATLALAAIAIISPNWRKPLAILLCTVTTAFLASPAVRAVDILIISYHPAGSTRHIFAHYGPMLAFRSSLLAVAFACSRLHRWLLEPPSLTGRTPA